MSHIKGIYNDQPLFTVLFNQGHSRQVALFTFNAVVGSRCSCGVSAFLFVCESRNDKSNSSAFGQQKQKHDFPI